MGARGSSTSSETTVIRSGFSKVAGHETCVQDPTLFLYGSNSVGDKTFHKQMSSQHRKYLKSRTKAQDHCQEN